MGDYELTVIEKPSYVHAVATGSRTAANVLRFLKDAHDACEKAGLPAVLIELRFHGTPLDTSDIFHVVSQRSAFGARLRRIAYVETGGSHDPAMARFAETVAVNRGVNVRLFETVAAAEKWLSK